MKLTLLLCFLLSGYEAGHADPAGPAQPADNWDPEGLHWSALGLQSSAETSQDPPGEHQQVSHRQTDGQTPGRLVKVKFRVNYQPLKLCLYPFLSRCVQRLQHSRAPGLGPGWPPLLHLLRARLLSAPERRRKPASAGRVDGLLLTPPQLRVRYVIHHLNLKPTSTVHSVYIVADAVDLWLQVWSNVTSSGAPEFGIMQRLKPRNTFPWWGRFPLKPRASIR